MKRTKPFLTVARDVEDIRELRQVLREADTLLQHARYVVVVPKDPRFEGKVRRRIPDHFRLGYSVPTRYGGTVLPLYDFEGRPVHLLGGRPDVQRSAAEKLTVHSIDCNRFTFDARFGDYFDGEKFRPHPVGGYERCIRDSVININMLWTDYRPNG